MQQTDWATTPAPLLIANGAFRIRPLIGSRSPDGTTSYALHVMDRDGGSLGYIHGYKTYNNEPIDSGQLAIDLRDWYEARTLIPAGTLATLTAMCDRDPAAFHSLAD